MESQEPEKSGTDMRKSSEKDINYVPPKIPESFIESANLSSDDISEINQILNKKKISSIKCNHLIENITDNCQDNNTENLFLFYLLYGIISFLSKIKTKQTKIEYLDSFEKLIERKDVQVIIFTKPDILYKFYSIIFNVICCKEYVKKFNEIAQKLDVQIRPNVKIFWTKFYNFLNTNVVVKAPSQSIDFGVSTFKGDKYLDNVIDKLNFFAFMGYKSFTPPKNYSYFYGLIFLYIIIYQPRNADFFAYIMRSDPIGSINYLIDYITENLIPESSLSPEMPRNQLRDIHFANNIQTIFEAFVEHKCFPDRDYLHYLTKACVPLVSNQEIFGDQSKHFDQLLLFVVRKLSTRSQKKFFIYLLRCYKKEKKSRSFNRKRFKFDKSKIPPIERGINFLKVTKCINDKKTSFDEIIRLIIISLLQDIDRIELQSLKFIIEAYLEMYLEEIPNIISLLSEFQKSEEWMKKYEDTIKNKQKEKDGQVLDCYIKHLLEQKPISSPSSDFSSLKINIHENFVTYDLIFLNDNLKIKNSKITFSDRVTIKRALHRIQSIGLYGNDFDDENLQNQDTNTTNNEYHEDHKSNIIDNNTIIEIDIDDLENEDIYHTMKLGRDSHFYKDGFLFGHQRSIADRSHREPVEIFGLSNYIDRTLSFNSLSFPNNQLYVNLVPIIRLDLFSGKNSKKKNIRIKSSQLDYEQPEVVSAEIILPNDIIPNDQSSFDSLTSNDMIKIYIITGRPPTLADAQKYVQVGKDINKFVEEIQNQPISSAS